MKSLLFFFDFISPYAYLATRRLPDLLRETSASLTCVPVLFAALLNANGQKGPAEITAKRRYTFVDCWRVAYRNGIPLQGPPTHPFNPLAALRMTVALEAERRWDFIQTLMNAAWAEGKDISDRETLISLADAFLTPGLSLWERSQTPEVKEALRRNTDDALQKGVFGVPSFWTEGELFWGCDRMDLLQDFLQGKLPPTPPQMEAVLARPSSSARREPKAQ